MGKKTGLIAASYPSLEICFVLLNWDVQTQVVSREKDH